MHWTVAFQIAEQTYVLPVEQVARIINMAALTPLLGVEQAVVGAINVQGQIVPVVDLRRHFRLPPRAWKRHTPIVLVLLGGRTVGLIADAVTDVLNLSTDQILRAADVLPADWPAVPLLHGIVRTVTGDLWLLLDLAHLFRPDQVQALLTARDELMRAQTETASLSTRVSG